MMLLTGTKINKKIFFFGIFFGIYFYFFLAYFLVYYIFGIFFGILYFLHIFGIFFQSSLSFLSKISILSNSVFQVPTCSFVDCKNTKLSSVFT